MNRLMQWSCVLALSSLPAFADSVSPSTFSATLAVGETTTIEKTVTVSQQLTSNLDILFLVDTTGSMGPAINNVRAGFGSIVSSVSAIAPNTAFGLAQYKDVVDSQPFTLSANVTTNLATVQTALNNLVAGGGGDTPEAGLYGLSQAAGTASWRTGSQRFVVWVGDAPSHDPAGPTAVTESQAINALNEVGATTLAASVTSGPGLNAACDSPPACGTGQATRITAATGGSYLGTFEPNLLSQAIQNSIVSTITNYNSVSLSAANVPAGVSATFSPAINGSFDRSIDRTFNFTATYTGISNGVFNFPVLALVDGRTVAVESDSITVGVPDVPEPSTYALMAVGLSSLVALRRRRR